MKVLKNLDLDNNDIVNVNDIIVNSLNSNNIDNFYVNGGNTIGGNATIGLIDSFSLGIRTNNTDRISISSTGVITIGNLSGTGIRLVSSSATGVLSNISTVNNAVLVTDGSGVISFNTTLPSGLTLNINDNVFTISDNLNTTKQLQFQLSGISPSTLRTLTVPDVDGTIITGTGTANRLAKFGTIGITNSLIIDDGTDITISTTAIGGDVSISSLNATVGISANTSLSLSTLGGDINLSTGSGDINLTADNTSWGVALNGLYVSFISVPGNYTSVIGTDTFQLSNTAQTIFGRILNSSLTATRSFTLPDSTGTFILSDNCIKRTVSTTDATTTTIATISTSSNQGYLIKSKIVCRKTGGAGTGTTGDVNGYVRTVKAKNVAGTVTLGTISSDYTDEDIAPFNVTYTVSGTNILLQVSGSINNNVDWDSTSEILIV